MLGLIAVNGFFVAAEMGLARIRRTRVEQLADEGNAEAKLIQEELNNPDRFISACQMGITLSTLALGAAGEAAYARQVTLAIKDSGVVSADVLPVVQFLCFAIAFAFTAFLQTVFGELVPKVYTLERGEQVLLRVIHPMRLWIALTSPFLWVLNTCTAFVFKAFNIQDPPRRHFVHSGEELRMLVTASHEEGVLEEKEEEMLHSVFDFSETVVSEVMTPRVDMIGLAATATVNELVELALKHGHSRIPIYEEDIDSIFGAVHIRDALRAVVEEKGTAQVRELARKVLIVPENKDAGDLLTEFKKTKTHMAIVIDEYGGTRGLVTMEDLIEELVGDIADEHEIVEEYVIQQDDGSYVLDARISLDDLNEKLGLTIEDEEFNTLGGHVFGLLGREPKIGDEVSTDHYILRVEESDRHRILKVRLILTPKEETPEANGSTGKNGSSEAAQVAESGQSKPLETSK
jgi:CBS domain containing-hemolysin-like protein